MLRVGDDTQANAGDLVDVVQIAGTVINTGPFILKCNRSAVRARGNRVLESKERDILLKCMCRCFSDFFFCTERVVNIVLAVQVKEAIFEKCAKLRATKQQVICRLARVKVLLHQQLVRLSLGFW